MNAADRHNTLATHLLMSIGQQLPDAGSFAAEMVVLESVVAGLIASACIRYDRPPEATVEMFCEALKPRLDQVIYGRQQ